MYVSGHEHLTEGAEARDGIAKAGDGRALHVREEAWLKGAKWGDGAEGKGSEQIWKNNVSGREISTSKDPEADLEY